MSDPQRVSVGQAAANAMARFLKSQLRPDVAVMAQWPEPSDSLGNKTVSVVYVGKRQRLEVMTPPLVEARKNLSATEAQITVRVGSFMQPMQLDVWCTNQFDRDDLLAQLDEALTAGLGETLGIIDDPARDGVLLPLSEEDGYSGNVDCWFDEPEVNDAPDAVQRNEYRVTYAGEARGVFSRVVTVARMLRQHLALTTFDDTPLATATGTAAAAPMQPTSFLVSYAATVSPYTVKPSDVLIEFDGTGWTVEAALVAILPQPSLYVGRTITLKWWKWVDGQPPPVVMVAGGGLLTPYPPLPSQSGAVANQTAITDQGGSITYTSDGAVWQATH